MKLYLVRHGESYGNLEKRFLPDGGGLTVKGKHQAEKLAKRFRRIPIEIIFSSDYRRAADTAKVIRRAVRKKLIFTKLVREQKYPKEYRGRYDNDPEIARIRSVRHKHLNKKAWHYSDEENFFDFKERIKKFLRFISRRKEKHILAVGHGISTRMAVALMLLGDTLTPEIFQEFRNNLLAINTGITICESHDGKWKVITWNDHAHLG